RKKKTEPVARCRLREVRPSAKRIRDTLAAWGKAAVEQLRQARPCIPEQLGDRAAEVWESLLAIAEAAGGDWPKHAQAAATELSGGEADTESIGVLLLRAIYDVFHPRPSDPEARDYNPIERILTGDLLAALIERESEPWGAWWGRDLHQAVQGPATKL